MLVNVHILIYMAAEREAERVRGKEKREREERKHHQTK